MDTRVKVLKQVRAALEHEPRVNLHRYPIRMDLDTDGAIILEGEVENIIAKKVALELTAAVTGVSGIVDRLRVVPAERMGDGAIRDHVRDAFLQEPALENCAIRVRVDGRFETVAQPRAPAGFIEVAVEDGVVTLTGEVNSLSHKRLAGVLAWWTRGSRDVVDGLEVVPPQEEGDDEITEAVRLVLAKDPLVNGDLIRVRTRAAVVTLEGLVANENERRMAEIDAWYVFGVDKVINHLETFG
jgi:osmotically-inducible protein OsmY